MKKISSDTTLAWQIAVWEAGIAKHQYIEKEHILIGICSLEKVLMHGGRIKLDSQTRQALQVEYKAIEDVLHEYKIDSTHLRRKVRDKLEEGNYQHTEQVIHRSEACKEVFKRAEEFAVSAGDISCIHLLAAILKEPGDIISSVLEETDIKLLDLREQVFACAKKWKPTQPVDNYLDKHKIDLDDAYNLPDTLSQEANQILTLAQQESERLMHFYLGAEHIFIALTKVENGLTQAVLKHVNLDPNQLRDKIHEILVRGDGNRYWDGLFITPRCRTILKSAEEEALRRESQVEEQDLLLSILKEEESIPVRVLRTMNDDSIQVMIKLIEQGEVETGEKKIPFIEQQPVTPATSLLEKYGSDLTQLAKEGKYNKIIERRDEILDLIQTLTRETKNNAILIGEAGVGKTAIVKGLAIRIASGNLTPELIGKRVIELDMALLTAGTKYRGEFEERLTGIIKEASNPDIILFIDEIHTLVGAGAAEGSMDASNILKPALAGEEIKCIGATTVTEYRKYIEKDPALERRFRPIMVEEPSIEAAKKILEGLREKLEQHPHVKITDGAIKAAVELSARYLLDRRLPDKAIDLLDSAYSKKKVPVLSMHGKMPEAESIEVNAEDIAEVLSQWTGLPVKKLSEEEQDKLIHMEKFLQERVVGQDEAIEKVSRRIRMARAGLLSHDRPIGVFLFLGPSGVGKTELTKTLSVFLFDSEKQMIRLDMSEYMEKHSISRLIGAPPGYIGHEEEGQLTGALRIKPYSVVLLDEVEKAHPEVFDLFLQVFDEGRLTDSKGRTVDAKNAIFIMTSNIGSEVYFRGPKIDKENQTEEILKKVKSVLRPEFFNRIDEIIIFNSLSLENINKIAQIMLENFNSHLKESGISFHFNQNVTEFICEYCDPAYGARQLEREIEKMVMHPLSDKILRGDFTQGDVITIDATNGEITFTKEG